MEIKKLVITLSTLTISYPTFTVISRLEDRGCIVYRDEKKGTEAKATPNGRYLIYKKTIKKNRDPKFHIIYGNGHKIYKKLAKQYIQQCNIAKSKAIEDISEDSSPELLAIDCATCFEKLGTKEHERMVLVPCGHAVACSSCIPRLLKKCPICRAKFKQAIKLHA